MRVKDRLSTGNRDILINFLYRDTLLVEMQLGVKTNYSASVKHSNAFSHFIYELKRSKFGPLTELCNIWATKDPRAKIYSNLSNDKSWKFSGSPLKSCNHIFNKSIILPFQCFKCQSYYHNLFYGSF